MEAVTIELRPQQALTISGVRQALRVLTEDWPQARGPRHRDAVETCLKVIDGHRSASEIRRVLIEAAAEAGLSAT
ncbi:DUF982 domain-containing protein [Arvimicrobium flavum]|uniref:DUF982 domain-containing protein n=1 Tax=Arvimicrobium flavum TaxID=3393320 RepID=UPI00237B305D|nr:DUF982 domain-containing protein [Mesorhizobium shangrilense]